VKGIPFEQHTVNLLKNEHQNGPFADKLPFNTLPAFHHNGLVLGESMAIMEYLEEKFPGHRSLLPGTAEDRARIRSLCLLIVASTQPLQNLAVLHYLAPDDEAKRQEWARHWIERAFSRLEKELAQCAGKFAYGDQLTMLDCCIPPQVHNAKR
jgi:maleylacetoacetate isomerase